MLAVALHAGCSVEDAERIAFFAQLPDLVVELDASVQSVVAVALYVFRDAPPQWRQTCIRNFIKQFPKVGRADAGMLPTDFEGALAFNRGLHCLTGGSAGNEQQHRLHLLKCENPNTFAFGLAVHAYGDAFAHSLGDQMYTPVEGHAFEGARISKLSDLSRVRSSLWSSNRGHNADSTAFAPMRYLEYVTNLFGVFWTKVPPRFAFERTQKTRESELVQATATLGIIGQMKNDSEEREQIYGPDGIEPHLRREYPDLHHFNPPNESVVFSEAVSKYPRLRGVSFQDLEAAARRWDAGRGSAATKNDMAIAQSLVDGMFGGGLLTVNAFQN